MTWEKPLAGSLLTHAAILGTIVFSGLLHFRRSTFGDPHVSTGSVGVGITKTIPIPKREGPVNPLANQSKSIVPQAPAPIPSKEKMQVKVPARDAIPLATKTEKPLKLTPKRESATPIRPMAYEKNQVYSKAPQALNSPMYGMQGAGGIDIGPASVLGDRFGAYVQLMRDRITQHWATADVHTLPSQRCAVTFTIARNGSVTNVSVSQPSGNYLLDTSAKRAILDANPLPALPPQFDRNEATVQLWFQLQK